MNYLISDTNIDDFPIVWTFLAKVCPSCPSLSLFFFLSLKRVCVRTFTVLKRKRRERGEAAKANGYLPPKFGARKNCKQLAANLALTSFVRSGATQLNAIATN